MPHGYGDTTTVADVLDSASEKIDGAFVGEPEVEAEVRRSLGMAYLNIGHWKQGEKHLAATLALRRQALGSSHDKTLQWIEDLQLTYSILDNPEGSLQLEQELIASMAERAGSADPSPFLNHSSMAYRLERVGRLSEAEQVAREIWESNSAAQGQNSEEALSDQAYYSWLLMRNGNYQEAEELSLDALARSSEALGKDHDITTSARSAAAAVHIAQGKVGEARELYGNRRMPVEINIEHEFQGGFDPNSEPFQLLVFFEEWCPFSQNAIPRAETIHRQYRGQGLDVIGFTAVDRSSTDDKVRQLLSDKDITFSTVKENGRLWNYFNCQGTPSFRLLHEGYLIWENELSRHSGAHSDGGGHAGHSVRSEYPPQRKTRARRSAGRSFWEAVLGYFRGTESGRGPPRDGRRAPGTGSSSRSPCPPGGRTRPTCGSPPCSPQIPTLRYGLVSRPRSMPILTSSPTPTGPASGRDRPPGSPSPGSPAGSRRCRRARSQRSSGSDRWFRS